ncbi:MAG TPA: hypothetical protein VN946_04810 [Terriglobales bacterium]|jgi:hypothetical protein|nr:hypothetical protein [Terriglobales bacterium]
MGADHGEDALKAFQGWCTLTKRKIHAAILPNGEENTLTCDDGNGRIAQERAQRLQEGQEKPLNRWISLIQLDDDM